MTAQGTTVAGAIGCQFAVNEWIQEEVENRIERETEVKDCIPRDLSSDLA